MLVPLTVSRESGPALPSATQTEVNPSAPTAIHRPIRIPDGTLRLRGASVENRRVRWGDDVIDNEGMGKKKSKVCCIYRRQRAYDESSDESDSSSDDDSEDEGHNHRHGKNCGHSPMRGQKGNARDNKRSSSPNAYEKMPKPSRKKPSN